LGGIIGDIQYQTDLQLQAGGQTEMYGIIFSGAWIEAMYIGAQVYKKEGNDNVVLALLEQMAVLKSILEELNSYDTQDADLKAWIADLSALQTVVDAMPSIKKLNENPDLEFKDVKPTAEEMAPVIQKIEELRAAIVKG
jgi:peptidoglycan hydrolase CwlO-like protein